MKERKIIIGIIMFLILVLGILIYLNFGTSRENKMNISDEGVSITTESTVLDVDYNEVDLKEDYSEYVAKINLNDLSVIGDNVKIEDNKICISSAGIYYFSGTTENASIEINAGKDDKVILIFDNANITSKTTSVINGISADKIVINLKEGSNNTFTDSSQYTDFTDDDEPDSLIFSKTDLTINGNGNLIVNSNYKDGIASKDTLKIINSNITINSNDDGIRGKDKVILKDVNLLINSKGDGIKSTNEEESGKGFINIDGGTININSEGDGISSATILNISNNSVINIKTTGDVEDKTQGNEKDPFSRDRNENKENSTENTVSSKGLKAGTEISIDGTTVNISSTDDAFHSNGFIIIKNINAKIETGDDAIHSENSLIINDGVIDISKSYEGLEAQYIEIDDGEINIVASDDGINVNGGNDAFGMMGQSQTTTTRLLFVKGGNININADGDGIDSNGSVKISDGNIIVAGPTNNGNGSLDYNGSFEVTGGKLIYYGASGMWQDPTSTSTINTVSFLVTGNNGDKLELKNESGEVIMVVTAEKSYQRISFVSKDIETNKTYKLFINDEEYSSLTVSSYVTSNSSNSKIK